MALKIDKVEEEIEEAPVEVKKEDKAKDKKKNQAPQGSDLKTILAAIHKEKGPKSVIRARDIAPVDRLPTGIFEWDHALGGGFPKGRYSIVYGVESSMKSTIALLAIAQAQKLSSSCNKAIVVNLEQTFSPEWAQKHGVNVDELLVVNPAYGEEAVDVIDALMRADDVAVIVVDSVAALISSKEIAKSVEEYDVGTSAMLIKRMVNKMMVAFGEEAKRNHFPCIILINQRRFRPGVLFGDPEIQPGGEALRFLASLIVRTFGKNKIDKGTNMTTFKTVNAVVKKAKVPIRAMSFSFDLCVHPAEGCNIGETDSFGKVKGYLQTLGLFDKTNKGYTIQGEETVQMTAGIPTKVPKYWDNQSQIQDEYKADPVFAQRLRDLVNDSMQEFMLVEEKVDGPAKVDPGEAYVVGDID